MKQIIIGTHRPDSNSKKVALYVQNLFRAHGETVGVLDLAEIEVEKIHGGHFGGQSALPPRLAASLKLVEESDGIIFVIPEYNGSMPGVLKAFVDLWKYPQSFEGRPVAFIGLGGLWAGLRPVEHMMQVMSYRNAYLFPLRVFMRDVWKIVSTQGEITDLTVVKLLNQQVTGFQKFCRALQAEELHANRLIQNSKK
jgi:chromate reductase